MGAHVAYPNCKPVNNPVFGDEATPPLIRKCTNIQIIVQYSEGAPDRAFFSCVCQYSILTVENL